MDVEPSSRLLLFPLSLRDSHFSRDTGKGPIVKYKLIAGSKFLGLSIKLIGSVYETTETVKQALHVHNKTVEHWLARLEIYIFVTAKTFHVTVQLVETNLLQTSLKILFQSRFSIYICRMNVLNKVQRWYYTLYLIVTQWFIELKWLSICKIYVKSNGLKMSFKIGVSIQCFWQRPP